MLPKIVLTLLQLSIAWIFSGQFRGLVSVNIGALDIFLTAVVVAVLVWLTGHIGALVLKDTPPPSAATLTACLVLALAGAAITLIPPVTQIVGSFLKEDVPLRVYPLIGAIVGYFIKR